MTFEVTDCFEEVKELLYPTPPEYTKLTFTSEAWLKLMFFIHLIGKYEITGFGRVVDNQIVDIDILKQKVQTTTVDVDVDEMLRFIMSLPEEERGQWVLDWHSHVEMGAFVSGTDSSNYDLQYQARLNQQYPYLIVNKKQSCLCECYVNPYKKTKIDVSILKSDIPQERMLEIYNECAEKVKTLCTAPLSRHATTYTTSKYFNDDYSDWDRGVTSNKIDLSSVKKNDWQSITSTIKKSVKDKNYCVSCETYLVSPSEYARGICDDCWEQMSYKDRSKWCEEQKLSPYLIGLN